jgi:hypothetical protein
MSAARRRVPVPNFIKCHSGAYLHVLLFVLSREFSEAEYASVFRHKEEFIGVIMFGEKGKLSASLHSFISSSSIFSASCHVTHSLQGTAVRALFLVLNAESFVLQFAIQNSEDQDI